MAEARRTEKLLSQAACMPVLVTPVIAILGATLTIKDRPADVAVIEARRLVRGLSGRQPVLSSEAIEVIGATAGLRSTWS